MTGIIHGEEFSAFVDSDIGVSGPGPTLVEITTGTVPPQHYWKAISEIGCLFGSPVHGELVGIGATREQALERWREEKKKLADSLWE